MNNKDNKTLKRVFHCVACPERCGDVEHDPRDCFNYPKDKLEGVHKEMIEKRTYAVKVVTEEHHIIIVEAVTEKQALLQAEDIVKDETNLQQYIEANKGKKYFEYSDFSSENITAVYVGNGPSFEEYKEHIYNHFKYVCEQGEDDINSFFNLDFLSKVDKAISEDKLDLMRSLYKCDIPSQETFCILTVSLNRHNKM